jgi:acetylornithine deacetylase
VASSAWFSTDIRAVPGDDPLGYVERYRRYIAEEIEPLMHAVAPETGVAWSSCPGSRP